MIENTPPGVGDDISGGINHEEDTDWLSLARDAYDFAISYVDTNYRKSWEDSIRAFNNQHPSDSKYNSQAFEKRSRLYRPKTRAVIRKNEAAAASAFFSNLDIVSVTATNQSQPLMNVSAEIMKGLLQYRLEKSIDWFKVVLGGLQDAQKTGAVAGRVYWDYDKKGKIDQPQIDLIPIENILIDPAASWVDPINTSPYVIHLMPMYVLDVKERMEQVDDKTGSAKWIKYPDNVIASATKYATDSTRINRERGKEDPQTKDNRPVSDYELVWVQRHIHRREGEDWVFYTLGTNAMLTKPVLLKEEVWHGMRDYVMGCCVLETHTSMPSSIAELSKGLQEEANEVVNQRLDNVKLVLNKRWFAKRGKNVDLSSLVRNVPGGVTLMDDIDTDVKEINWPDVTGSSYQEQDRINADMDELLGQFSPASLTTNPDIANNAPAKSMQLLSSPSNILTEYLLRTYVVTFVTPVLRLLVKLEQHYETDMTIMAIAAQNSQMFMRYGLNQVTDEMLNQDLTLTVNVGMGATDPNTKIQKFITGVTSYANIVKMAPPGMNINEIGKEIFGHLGYQDGRRFMTTDDPQKQQLMQQIQQLSQAVQQLQTQLKDKTQQHLIQAQAKKNTDIAGLQKEAMRQEGENKRAFVTHIRSLAETHMTNEAKNVIKSN